MEYTMIRRSWRFDVNGEIWNVVYNIQTETWVVNNHRRTWIQAKGEYTGKAGELEEWLSKGITQCTLDLINQI
jgi:hypothetical protein